MSIPYPLIGVHFDEWGNTDPLKMPRLWGKFFTPGADLDIDGSGSADGPERDTVVGLDLRSFAAGAWVKLDRFPSAVDPFPDGLGRERFPIFSRSAIAGSNNSPLLWTVVGSGSGKPRLECQIPRGTEVAAAFSVNTLPTLQTPDSSYWFFFGASYATGGAGPRLFLGDLSAAVAEVAYLIQQDGSGAIGEVSPGQKANGNWVDRWGFGPGLVGAITLPVPANGPGQLYGELGPTNTGFETMKGWIAHVTLWGGPLSAAQFETLRTALPASRRTLPGFPALLADWHLDEPTVSTLFTEYLDSSGNGHTLLNVNPDNVVERVSAEESLLVELDPTAYVRRRRTYEDTIPKR
jgi:hypothetical protein